ncbi:hypothetical protein ACFFP0_17315 [Rhizobium puerariae]|uniref:DUF1611 domain-containing protein n=1 Tax=Rhizobium puerariae TaxID=1585791 RepID=A0ABV6AJ23_9HYPH
MLPEDDVHDGLSRNDRLRARLVRAKRAFTTRHVRVDDAAQLTRDGIAPKPGDLLLARITSIGQHERLENMEGRRVLLYVGDEILVSYGHRYAPDQFESRVPSDLSDCALVAAGGIASEMMSKHTKMKAPTRIEPIGLLTRQDGTILNLADYVAFSQCEAVRPATIIAVVGSSMNAGKTTTAASLVRGLTSAGFRVGAAKLTGTGSGGDLWTMLDAGAIAAVDFTDAGHASTADLHAQQLETIARRLIGKLGEHGAEIGVVEIADGLLQRETAALIDVAQTSGWFRGLCSRRPMRWAPVSVSTG